MIKFQNVTQCFANGTLVFEDLSFAIEGGEVALITGPSGSGKTTILNLLIKEYQPTKGEIYLDSQLISQLPANRLPQHRRKIGVVFQDYKLIEELNVWENIALPLSIQGEKIEDIEERVTDLLKLVELTEKALVFPKQLSGGEAQRICIARALATGPSIIFADEPTGNLDFKTSQHILDLLIKINKLGTTLLIATHDPQIIEAVDTKRIKLSPSQEKEPLDQQGGKQQKTEPSSSQSKKNKPKKTNQVKKKAQQNFSKKAAQKNNSKPSDSQSSQNASQDKAEQNKNKKQSKPLQQAAGLWQKLIKFLQKITPTKKTQST